MKKKRKISRKKKEIQIDINEVDEWDEESFHYRGEDVDEVLEKYFDPIIDGQFQWYDRESSTAEDWKRKEWIRDQFFKRIGRRGFAKIYCHMVLENLFRDDDDYDDEEEKMKDVSMCLFGDYKKEKRTLGLNNYLYEGELPLDGNIQ